MNSKGYCQLSQIAFLAYARNPKIVYADLASSEVVMIGSCIALMNKDFGVGSAMKRVGM